MAIRKKAVTAAVESAAKTEEVENVVVAETKEQDFSDVFNVTQSEESKQDDDREYTEFKGKKRLIRTMPITWNAKYSGKSIKFCIYADPATCPPARFGSLSDLEYLERKYPASKQFFISDTLCSNGRHKYTIYRMHVTAIIDTVE